MRLPSTRRFIVEPTAELLAAQGQTSPYIVVGLSGGPGGVFNSNWGGANIYVSLDGSSFAEFGRVERALDNGLHDRRLRSGRDQPRR